MCSAPPPPLLAEIEVEACASIEQEPNLLVIGKVVAFIELNDESWEPLSVTRIEGWEDAPQERFVWMQANESTKSCEFIEGQEPFMARVEQPCCDVVTHLVSPDGKVTRGDKFSCIYHLREISEIQYH